VVVADDPRAVTKAKVEVSAALWTTQLVPFARQTAEPFTNTALVFNVVPEALEKPSHAVEVTEPTVRLLMALVFAFNVVPLAVANPSQTDDVPFVKFKLWRFVFPRTVNVLVTVELAPMNPPYKSNVEVAEAPRAVTDASVSLSASKYAGQLIPVVRQTVEPPIVSVPNVPLFAFSCVVEATPETNKFVVVAFVKVAFVAVRVWRFVFPVTVKVEVTVEEEPTKPPYN